ncbi:MAG: hypothetical protein M0T79_15445 [Actinomycetota bacterium]|nr:hypothetical protein [Actinomycetota bacterium]
MASPLSTLVGQAIDLVVPVAEDGAPWMTPWRDSRAGRELAAEEARHPEPEPGSWPWLLAPLVARCALLVGVEEAKVLRLALDADATSYGADVLCRSLLESLSLMWWLLDPDVDAPGRRARGMLYKWRTAVQTQNAVQHVGVQPDGDPAEYGELPEQVERDAASFGLNLKGTPRDTCNGEGWPSYTERVAKLVSNIWPQPKLPYAVLSAVAHGELLGLTRNVGSKPEGAASLRPVQDASGTWLWYDAYLASGALLFSAERAADFLGLEEQMRTVQVGRAGIQESLKALRPTPP